MSCWPPPNIEGPPDYVDGTPEIVAFTSECVVEKDRWELALEASFWTGGVDTFWSVDGVEVETHSLKTDRYAEDGTGEFLSLTLDIVVDPADVSNGTTAFSCGDDPSATLVMYETDNQPVACMDFGSDVVDWSAVPDLPECP